MGGYFLTNSNKEKEKQKVIKSFAKKGMDSYSRIELGNFTCFYFDKIYLKNKINHIYKKNEDYFIGVGTFFYKSEYGQKALEILYDNYLVEGEKIFNNVKGHFNFIFYINGSLKVITDKTGSYHSYYMNYDSNEYISTSLFSLGEISDKLTVSNQEVKEFINTEAVFCGKTIFNEIKYLPFGYVYQANKDMSNDKYFMENDNNKTYNMNEVVDNIIEELSFMKNINLKTSVELSAGFDSRTIASILKYLKIPHKYNTNYNSTDHTDHKLAVKIAKNESREIKIIEKRNNNQNYKELVEECFFATENARDVFRAAYTPYFFEEKAKHGDLVIGGYGGELYRDVKYKGINSFEDLIKKRYNKANLNNIDSYEEVLINKFKNYLNIDSSKYSNEVTGKIYYFIKMMFWGGSRISIFNQYCYRYHPLLDYNVIYPLFNIDEDKKNGEFQMKLIEKFDYRMSTYKSNYGYNFVWNKSKPLKIKFYNIFNSVMNKSKKMLKQKEKEEIYLKDEFVNKFINGYSEKKYITNDIKKDKLANVFLSRANTIQYIIDYLN